MKANLSDAGQNQEHSDSAEHSAKNNKSLPNPRPPLKVVVESSEADSKQHKAEYQYTYTLQRKTLDVQWYLLWATLLAFGAAAFYALVSKQQLATMNETLKEAHIQNVAQQKAALSFEVVPSFRTKYGLAITIHNTGRMKATLLTYIINYEQKVSYGQTFTHERIIDLRDKSESIAGGGEYVYNLEIGTPPLPRYIPGRGAWSVMTTLIIRYDNGFGEEGVRGCFSFNPKSGEWSQTCSWFASVDVMSDNADAADPKNK